MIQASNNSSMKLSFVLCSSSAWVYTCRTNVAYTLNNGQIVVKAYLNNTVEKQTVSVFVNAGVTSMPDGSVNGAVSYTLQYIPRNSKVQWLAFGVGAVISYVLTGALVTTILVCHLGYLTSPGAEILTLSMKHFEKVFGNEGTWTICAFQNQAIFFGFIQQWRWKFPWAKQNTESLRAELQAHHNPDCWLNFLKGILCWFSWRVVVRSCFA